MGVAVAVVEGLRLQDPAELELRGRDSRAVAVALTQALVEVRAARAVPPLLELARARPRHYCRYLVDLGIMAEAAVPYFWQVRQRSAEARDQLMRRLTLAAGVAGMTAQAVSRERVDLE